MEHRHILIVDDDREIAEELAELLESFDFPCSAVFNVDQALAQVSANPDITLIITDMRMPGRDGMELIVELSRDGTREFEFFMVSGHLDAAEDLRALKELDVTLLRKPLNIEDLMTALETLEFGG